MGQRKIITEFSEQEFTEIIHKAFINVDERTQHQRRPDKRFYPLSWVVEYTGIPKNSIYQMTSKRRIPHVRRGRRLFFDKDQINKWLEEGSVKTKAEILAESEDFLSKKGKGIRHG